MDTRRKIIKSPLLRLVSLLRPSGACWLYQGRKTPNGYGAIYRHGKAVVAHRAAYEMLVGPIAAGLQLDHLCRNRACCRPSHLEQVTCKVNLSRGRHYCREKTACPHGHAYAGDNLYFTPRGERRCRACRRDGMRKLHEDRKMKGQKQ